MTPATSPDLRKALEAIIRGQIHFNDSEGYDDARLVWNGMIDRRPAAIVRVAGVADVIASVNLARTHSLPLAIRCGGHNVSGNAVCDGGIVIDLSAMKSVRVDQATSTARAGGGLTWREYDYETQAFGLASTGGAISSTGIAGLTLGGGYGHLARQYGMACDHLLSADVVTAAGESVTASPASHPDLFWALRGGGGNFGVVTSFEFQLHPVREATSGIIAFPFGMAKPVLQRYRDLSLDASDEMTLFAGLLPAPDGSKIAGVVVSHFGTDEEAQRAIRPIRELGSVVMDSVARVPYCAVQAQLDASYPKGMRNYWKSAFFRQLPDEVIEAMIEAVRVSPSPMNHVILESYGGAITRVPKDATAFDQRDVQFNMLILGLSLDASTDQDQIAWARRVWQTVAPHSTGGSYVNYHTADEDVRTSYDGARLDRLAKIKAIYDPGNLFRFNQNIPPAKG
jgi:FAD/FMN-containing dehydrogenase